MWFDVAKHYSFADKQERTVGRSKVVRKFLYRNFLPPKDKNPRYMLPDFWNLLRKFYSMCAVAHLLSFPR